MRRWYPVGILLVGVLITVLGLRGSPVLLPVGLLILILGAYSVRVFRQRPAAPARVADAGTGTPAEFTIVLRGYARPFVDDMVRRGEEALAADPGQRAAVRAEVMAASFPQALRGYSVPEVDAYLTDLADRLDAAAPE